MRRYLFFDFTDAVAQILGKFAPFGERNLDPVFVTKNVEVKNITDSYYGQKQVWFEQNDERGVRRFPARLFPNNPALAVVRVGGVYDIAYNISYDTRNPSAPINLKLRDIKKL